MFRPRALQRRGFFAEGFGRANVLEAEPGARPPLAIVGPRFLPEPPETADRALAESLRALVMGW
jgi:hypothetical protein